MPHAETTDAKIDALSKSLDETKQDVRELRQETRSLRAEMHAGFTAARNELHTAVIALTASNAEIRASVKTLTWVVGILTTLVLGSLAAEKAPRLLKAIAEKDAAVSVAAVR